MNIVKNQWCFSGKPKTGGLPRVGIGPIGAEPGADFNTVAPP
jgi:hypothetical protein